jgi:ribose 5-phosphate isomerase B
MQLYIASDHGGLELKQFIISKLNDLSFIDCGTHTSDSVHYPNFADKLCKEVLQSTNNLGILICGTGIGISIRANRYTGIRAALIGDEFSAKMAKAHNNANVICLGGRTTSQDDAVRYITTWLNTEFEGGRHQERINMLDAPLTNK